MTMVTAIIAVTRKPRPRADISVPRVLTQTKGIQMNQCMTNDVSVSKPMKVLGVATIVFFVAVSFIAVGAIMSRAYSHTKVHTTSEAGL